MDKEQEPTSMTLQTDTQRGDPAPPPPLEGPQETHDHSDDTQVEGESSSTTHKEDSDESAETVRVSSKGQCNSDETALLQGLASATVDEIKEDTACVEDDNVRERLKRHRVEVAGRVWIPDIWGQEELLKDWIDCSAFDASLVPSGIVSARSALVEEGRRASSGRIRIENRHSIDGESAQPL